MCSCQVVDGVVRHADDCQVLVDLLKATHDRHMQSVANLPDHGPGPVKQIKGRLI